MAADDILLRVLTETSQSRRELESLRGAFEAALNRMAEAAKRPDFDPLSAEARILRREVEITGAKFVEVFNRADKEVRETARELHAARNGVRSLEQELARLGKGGGLSGLTGILNQIRSTLGGVTSALGIAFGGQQVVHFIQSAAAARIELQALRAQLDAAAGSTAAGGRAYEFARDKAIELGFSINDVVQAQARFEAATRQSNLTLAERRGLFEAVIETGRVLQLSQDRVNNAFLALEQIASKGRVSMEELRRQLGDQIPGVLPILARELGVTTGELIKMVEAGQLMADDALPALERGLRKAFGPGLAAAVETDAAALGRLRAAIFEAKAAFAEGFGEETTAAIEGLTEAIRENEGATENLGSGFGRFASLAKQAVYDFNVLLRTLVEYNKLVLDPESGTARLAAALGLIPGNLRDVEESIDGMRPAVELLAEKERELEEEVRANAEVNAERVRQIYGEMIPALEALAKAQDEERKSRTADVIARARRGDKEAQEQVKELMRLGREQVKALKERRDALDELAIAESKELTLQEQIAAALQKSAQEQEEFNQKLFESSGNTFKSAEELDKLRVRIINAVDSLVLLGATSVEQTDKALDFALKVAAGYRAMGEAVPLDLVATIDRLAAASVEGAAKVVKALTEEAEAYAALGEAIPPELLARIERLTEVTEGHTRAIALSVLGMKEFREELFGSGAAIETRAAQIVKLVDSLGLLGPATAEQSEIIKEEIQEQLDAYAELGERPPIELQAIADRFGVVTSRIEEQRKALQALLADFAALGDKIKATRADNGAAKDLADQRAELEALQTKQRESGVLTLEEVERLGELEVSVSRLAGEVEGLGTAYDKFGDQATASIQDVDDAIRDLLRSNQEALAGLPAATQEAVINILGGLQSAAQQGFATEEVIRDAMLKIGDQLKIAGVDTADFAQAMEDASGSGLNLTQELAKLGEGTGDASDAMAEYREKVEKVKKEQQEATDAAKEMAPELKKAADAVVAEADRMVEPLEKVRDLIGQIVELCRQWQSCIAGTA